MFLRFVIVLLLGAPSLAMAATIMVFGDSLSSAYGLQRDQGWTTLMERRLAEKTLDYKVANASISGETTAGGLRRIQGALREHHPAVLILDEATSNLDPETEAQLQEAVNRLSYRRTVLVIAHRLSTIRNAQRIVVLTDNGIEEQGTHEELIALDGAYASLCNMQLRI